MIIRFRHIVSLLVLTALFWYLTGSFFGGVAAGCLITIIYCVAYITITPYDEWHSRWEQAIKEKEPERRRRRQNFWRWLAIFVLFRR